MCQFSIITQLAGGADSALDALSDTLKDIAPATHPEPVLPTKDIVKVADWTGVASVGGRGFPLGVSGGGAKSFRLNFAGEDHRRGAADKDGRERRHAAARVSTH